MPTSLPPQTEGDVLSDAQAMVLALEQAQCAAQMGEVPVGAVLLGPDGRLLSVGANRTVCDHDPTQHAEIVALRAATRKVGNYRLPGASLFVTLEPCMMCLGALLHARLSRVVWAAADPKTGVCGSVESLHLHPILNHHTRVSGGLMAEDAAQALRDFFRERREQKKLQKQAESVPSAQSPLDGAP